MTDPGTIASDDRSAILLLCADVEERRQDPTSPRRLTTAEWNALIRTVRGTALERPAAVAAASVGELVAAGLSVDVAERVARLADRRVRLQLALDALAARGIWVTTHIDAGYPALLLDRLGARRPVVLAGAGPIGGLGAAGVAVVGSRDVDAASGAFATTLGESLGRQSVAVVSGGARGVDRLAASAAVEAGGAAVGVLADSLAKAVLAGGTRRLVAAESVTLVTPYSPWAPFSAGAAMGRNKLVYTLSRAAVVVASAHGEGGTWAGAIENLEHRWVPLFVRSTGDAPAGNAELIRRGAARLDDPRDIAAVVGAEPGKRDAASALTLF